MLTGGSGRSWLGPLRRPRHRRLREALARQQLGDVVFGLEWVRREITFCKKRGWVDDLRLVAPPLVVVERVIQFSPFWGARLAPIGALTGDSLQGCMRLNDRGARLCTLPSPGSRVAAGELGHG